MKKFIPIAKVELGNEEIQAALEVFKSGNLCQGEKTKEFERSFAKKVGAMHAVACSSGTTALHIAYLALTKPGEEVLVPAFTHISTASMVCFSGAKPVFCDIDPRTFTIDLKEIRRRITSKTKAIAPVHLFGNACEIDEILNIAKENNLRIIWDAAQAHGTKYKNQDVGSFDDLVCYSFYPTKNMITGEGGMITTNNPEFYERLKLLRSHGQEKKYFHTSLGFNYRMTDIEATVGVEQLKKLDGFIERRRRNAEYLSENLSNINGLTSPFSKEYVRHSYHQYSILLDKQKLHCSRDEFAAALKEKGIGTGVHYPRPLHQQPVFKKLASNESLPVSEQYSKEILSLPVYPDLDKSELDMILQGIIEVMDKNI
ncbi:MAG: DegT/DnrJ/EryC1/StrS family aminotransferase [Candidatus Hodarchaeota archaeon]